MGQLFAQRLQALATDGGLLQLGQEVWVKLMGFDDRGKVRLSMKVVDQETGEEAKKEEKEDAE